MIVFPVDLYLGFLFALFFKLSFKSEEVLRFLITGIRLALVLYFFMVTYKVACQTLSKALLKSMKTW